MNKRIWFSTTSEHREIEKLERNQHKDILIQLDGGEVWQFTPHQKGIKTPPVSRISSLGHGTDIKTGKMGFHAWLSLENPTEHIDGNLRKLDRKQSKNSNNAGAKPIYDHEKDNQIFKQWNKWREQPGNGKRGRKTFLKETGVNMTDKDLENLINRTQKRLRP